MTADLTADRDAFFDQFTKDFFSVDGELKVTEAQRSEAIVMCQQSDQKAALACMASFGSEDFREDLPKVTVPTLVIHGDSDATVPFQGSGARTHEAIGHSRLVVLADAPHGATSAIPESSTPPSSSSSGRSPVRQRPRPVGSPSRPATRLSRPKSEALVAMVVVIEFDR